MVYVICVYGVTFFIETDHETFERGQPADLRTLPELPLWWLLELTSLAPSESTW
jgi:hypothetical protein